MKLEVIKCSTQESIVTYSAELSILDFQEWKDQSEPVVISLNHLKDTVADLDSTDPETKEPVSNPKQVDFYLPDPLKNRVISRLTKSQTDMEGESDLSADKHSEATERISMPWLKSSTILLAVVTEILQNHLPPSDYKVRISDG